jgi:hypothetical protein
MAITTGTWQHKRSWSKDQKHEGDGHLGGAKTYNQRSSITWMQSQEEHNARAKNTG